MSDVEPLIRRELQWMAHGVLEDKDLASIIIAKSRKRRIRRIMRQVLFAVAVSVLSIGAYEGVSNYLNTGTSDVSSEVISGGNSTTPSENSSSQGAQKSGVISDYPVTWEQSIGDLSAISKAASVGDTLGGLTAQKLTVEWTKCRVGKCPTTWTLAVANKTEDIISVAPSLMVYVDHAPLISSSRPLTVFPGALVNLVFSFPEFADISNVDNTATWQWNWFLTVAR